MEAQDLNPDWTPTVHSKTNIQSYQISKALEGNRFSDLFTKFTEAETQQFISYMDRCEFNADVNIITEGDEGDYFYVIASGACDVLVKGKRVTTASA